MMYKSILFILPILFSITIFETANAKQPETLMLAEHYQNIELSLHESVLLIEINNPPRNAVSKQTLTEIDKVLTLTEHNDKISAIVISGSHGMFSLGAGADNGKNKRHALETHSFTARKVYNNIEQYPKLIIAAISGMASGGGHELALACDIRLASDKAKFVFPELEVGLIPGFGGMQRLKRIIGSGRATEMMITGRTVEAEEALAIGLISSIIPAKRLIPEAVLRAQELSEKVNANALALFKLRMSNSGNESYSLALHNDQLAFDQIFFSKEGQAALNRYIEKLAKKGVKNKR